MSAVNFDYIGTQVLVTGATRGIGLATARAFAAAGARVTVTGTAADPSAYAADLSGLDYVPLDLTDPASVDTLVSRTEALDVLVNNAGANLPGGRDEWAPGVFAECVGLNLLTPFRLTTGLRHALAASDHEGGAAVVNTASMTALFGLEMVPAYGAAKAAVVQLTKTLAVSWARHGIRVNCVAPGLIETDMTAPMMDLDELTAPTLARTPIGRFGSPEDVAGAVLFLASPAARYVTGQTLCVDGGFSVQG